MGTNPYNRGLDKGQPVRRKRRRKKKKNRFPKLLIWIVLLILTGGCVNYSLPRLCVKKEITIQAGEPCPDVSEFLNWGCEGAYIVPGIHEVMEFNHVKDYEVIIHLYGRNVTTTLHVVDTIPPELQTKNKTILLGEPFALEDFIEFVYDVTNYEVSYKQTPNIEAGGTYLIELQVWDEGGNVTTKEAYLEVLTDVTPPVIEGVKEITITVGESVSYKRNVTVTDDQDDNVKLEVDNSQVDTNTPGDYIVTYRATDSAGNTTEVSTILHVKAVEETATGPLGEEITEAYVNAEADKILASITNSSMSQKEVLRAIYDWCHGKIAFVDEAPKDNWVEGAYYGLVLRKGDCYTYAMTAKCLLTRAGITNKDIERIRYGNGMHFWNLVDIGEGWHHFDTCRRADGSTFFYLTDAELMEYSNAHTGTEYPNGTHYYDRELYPDIP